MALIQIVFGSFQGGGRRVLVRKRKRLKSTFSLQEDGVEPYQDLQNWAYSYCVLWLCVRP